MRNPEKCVWVALSAARCPASTCDPATSAISTHILSPRARCNTDTALDCNNGRCFRLGMHRTLACHSEWCTGAFRVRHLDYLGRSPWTGSGRTRWGVRKTHRGQGRMRSPRLFQLRQTSLWYQLEGRWGLSIGRQRRRRFHSLLSKYLKKETENLMEVMHIQCTCILS